MQEFFVYDTRRKDKRFLYSDALKHVVGIMCEISLAINSLVYNE